MNFGLLFILTNWISISKKLVNMNKYKFLKSISDNHEHFTKDPSLNTSENRFLLKLKKEGLIDAPFISLSNGKPGIDFYTITGKGLEYVDNHKQQTRRWIITTSITTISTILSGVIVALILYYFHIRQL